MRLVFWIKYESAGQVGSTIGSWLRLARRRGSAVTAMLISRRTYIKDRRKLGLGGEVGPEVSGSVRASA
jgi:hypothetical protein